MMSPEAIRSMSRRAAERNRDRQPLEIKDWDLVNDETLMTAIKRIPFLGVQNRKGYHKVDPVKMGKVRGTAADAPFVFADNSGFGDDDEPALSLKQLLKFLRDMGPGYHYWIAETGQFQIVLAVAQKKEVH